MWHHGDYGEFTEHDGVVIHGRSDAVLNRGGVRIGTAEIYRQVETIDEVLECIAIGRDVGADIEIMLFVRLRAGVAFDAALEKRIKQAIRTGTSPRHVPDAIIAGTRHSANAQRQAGGTGSARRGQRTRSEERRRTGQPRGARPFPEAALRALRLDRARQSTRAVALPLITSTPF